jgi:hypothetical protein
VRKKLKIKIPSADLVVPDWATFNPELSLWNYFEVWLERESAEANQSAAVTLLGSPHYLSVKPSPR